MNVILPATVVGGYSTLWASHPDYGSHSRICGWVVDSLRTHEDDLKKSYFRERRRRNFSDVCHAKLETGIDLANRIPGYTMRDTGNTKYYYGDFDLVSTDPNTTYVTGVKTGANKNVGFFVYVRFSPKGTGANYLQVEAWYLQYKSRTRTYRQGVHGTLYQNKLTGELTNFNSSYNTEIGKQLKMIVSDWSVLNHGDTRGSSMAVRDLMHRVFNWFEALYAMGYKPLDYGKSDVNTALWSVGDWVLPSFSEDTFLLHEPGVIIQGLDDLMFGKGTEHYFRQSAVEHAYLDALQHVPRMNDNNVSNMLEIAGFVKALVVDHRIEIPESLSDLWLSYRYSYTTTKLDAEEAIKFVHRHMDLGFTKSFKVHGSYTFDYKGAIVTCRCTARVTPKELNQLGKIWRALYTYGLSPSFYMVWDVIPYSFIVDWFLPIGDVTAAWDAEREYKQNYSIEDINFSLEYSTWDHMFPVHCYTRWLSSTPPSLHGYYFLESGRTSKKTFAYRILDAASLILG